MTTRRDLLVVIGLSLATAPWVCFAQQPARVWRVGFLTAQSRAADGALFKSLQRGMRELGYVEGRNIAYETRWGDGKLERLPALVTELIGRKPDVMVVANTPSVIAAKKATRTLPIVMVAVGDPVGTGLVASLARPGGNITGITNMGGELAGKKLELLKQAVPRLSRVAVLGHPDDPIFAVQMRSAQAVARKLKVDLFPVEIRAVSELDRAFETLVRRRANGVLRLLDPLANAGRQRTSELAIKHRLPTIGGRLEEVQAGMLISYSATSNIEHAHQAATFVDKILKGAKPADLPVEQPTRFLTYVNLNTAKAIGVTIPQPVLLRADKVIE